jgi:PAS domain S-box-containing protein
VKTVLIIEDNAELASHWQFAFERHEIHVIHETAYEQAIEVLGQTPVDLVITDIELPSVKGELFDFAGLAILSYIALQVEHTPKVIAVSGTTNTQPTNKPFAHLLSCAQLLQKPFEVQTLVTLGLQLLDERADEFRREEMRSVGEAYATDSVIWFSHNSNIVSVNSQATDLLGYSVEEFQQTTVDRLFPDGAAQVLATNIERLQATESLKFNLQLQKKDETQIQCELFIRQTAIVGDDFVFARLRDVTEEKLQQEELRLLGAAVKSTQDAFLIAKFDQDTTDDPKTDPEIRVIFANESYSRMTGFTFEETIGKKPRLLQGPDTNRDALITIADALEHLLPVRATILLYEKDGTAFWCDFQVAPIADEQGLNTHWMIVMRDITEMKESNRALKALSSSHRTMVEFLGTSAGVWDWDVSSDAMECSPRVREMLGYALDDPDFPKTASAFFEIMHPEDTARVRASIQQGIESSEPVDHELRFRHKDGHYIWLNSRGTTSFDAEGNPTRIVRVTYDISKRKAVEEELAQKREVLERSNSDLEQFAYVASHDLQEPLRAVGGFMQVFQREYGGQLDEKGARYVRKAVEGAARMQQLINDLLHFSRITRESQQTEPVDLNKAVEQALVSLSQTVKERNASVVFADLPSVDGDLSQLAQVFQNLIDNGTKYCESDSPVVRITHTELDDHYLVSVADNGIGIEPEYREQIFAIFKRLHRREEYPGTGIGLAICQRVLQRHGGSISIEDAEGGGSQFILKLPKIGEDRE